MSTGRRAIATLLLLVACHGDEVRPPAAAGAGVDAEVILEPDPGIRGLEDAKERYKSERYQSAAWGFAEIVAGRLAGDREAAELWLAKCYLRLDAPARATRIFIAIAERPEHSQHTLALPWLLTIRRDRPDDRQVLAAIGRYSLDLIDDESVSAIQDELRVVFAAHRLGIGDASAAWSLTAAIGQESDVYSEAQLLAGLAAERLGRWGEGVQRLRIAATYVAPHEPRLARDARSRTRVVRERAREELARYEAIRERARRELARHGERASPSR